ncbi:hypothetical protein [Mucilaginibacter sp. SP1R1]|uniref:hypothetical protein n=1 Tax=Mucilaginibacter sp. SP1R1 TaxID=2723091 RepID=UPI00160A10D4|nr:hypothetical protein [Mucilaginibacter sp. SP1R1]MBB6149291.1 YD repeat-containing protein [Mucilaginibacter sp. SP1R1]
MVLISLSIITFASCKKNHDQNHQSNCQLTSIARTANGNLTNIKISYDAQARVSAVDQSGFIVDSRNFVYKNNTVLIYKQTALSDSLTLNAAGYLLNDRLFALSDKSSWLNWQYELNANNEAVKFTLTNSAGRKIAEQAYVYVDGNMIQDASTKYIYDTGKPAKTGDYFNVTRILATGIQHPVSKNLVTGTINGTDTIRFNYVYDANDRITEINLTGRSITGVNQIKPGYTCN